MTPDDIELPTKSDELLEIEARFSRIRQQSREVEQKLKVVSTAISRSILNEGTDLDEIAAKLASGEVVEFTQENLPLQRHALEQRLEAFRRSEGMLFPELERLRRKHANQTAAAIRPKQRAAVEIIDKALQMLLAGIDAERAAHAIVPGAPLTACSFPGIDEERVRLWRGHAVRHGLLDDPKSSAAPKGMMERLIPRRSAAKANGAAREPMPLVAKGSD
jgi:hypothetical protein